VFAIKNSILKRYNKFTKLYSKALCGSCYWLAIKKNIIYMQK